MFCVGMPDGLLAVGAAGGGVAGRLTAWVGAGAGADPRLGVGGGGGVPRLGGGAGGGTSGRLDPASEDGVPPPDGRASPSK
jgi:hypothetical protein